MQKIINWFIFDSHSCLFNVPRVNPSLMNKVILPFDGEIQKVPKLIRFDKTIGKTNNWWFLIFVKIAGVDPFDWISLVCLSPPVSPIGGDQTLYFIHLMNKFIKISWDINFLIRTWLLVSRIWLASFFRPTSKTPMINESLTLPYSHLSFFRNFLKSWDQI